MDIVLGLFLITIAAALGGLLAKSLKLPGLVGYIIAGVAFGVVLPENLKGVSGLAQLGTILLLFSIGIELSLTRLSRFLKVAVIGSIIQIVLVTISSYIILNLFSLPPITSLILALGFSLSSTAVVVKLLSERGELETIHGGVMLGWLLCQDLAVIPIMVMLPVFTNLGSGWEMALALALGKAALVVVAVVILGKLVIPFLMHKIAAANSRELLLLSSVGLALGTAAGTSYFGISPTLGAFLAGIVISDSQEHHAIFAETRPLRDLFMALFFVSLGFLVNPGVIVARLPLILSLALIILVLKAVVVFIVSSVFGYRGKTAIAASLGLAQVGEFAFVIFSIALGLKLISPENTTLGISVTLLTLILTPIIFKGVLPLWRKLRDLTVDTTFGKLFTTGEKRDTFSESISEHIIICGYGRVGKWVGRALSDFGIPFVVVEYNQKIVQDLKEGGISVLYGDPTEPEVLEAVGIRQAKAVVLAIPDAVAQETLIAYIQTVAPDVKIISRVHDDSDWEKHKALRVDKIVQPEFEAAIEIIRSILLGRGKNRVEISEAVKSLRVSHSR
jgi:CPA2 family monovalent cation:H+ antiporter-2